MVYMVYIDTPVAYAKEPAGYVGRPRRAPLWCHMIADTEDELHAMAARLGLLRDWYQGNHYDLTPTKRGLAIQFGAVACNRHMFIKVLRQISPRR